MSYAEIAEKMAKCSSNANQYVFWNFAVPKNDGKILGCHESYNLIEISAENNALLDSISYYPGISIAGCKFIRTVTDEYVRAIINANKGRPS